MVERGPSQPPSHLSFVNTPRRRSTVALSVEELVDLVRRVRIIGELEEYQQLVASNAALNRVGDTMVFTLNDLALVVRDLLLSEDIEDSEITMDMARRYLDRRSQEPAVAASRNLPVPPPSNTQPTQAPTQTANPSVGGQFKPAVNTSTMVSRKTPPQATESISAPSVPRTKATKSNNTAPPVKSSTNTASPAKSSKNPAPPEMEDLFDSDSDPEPPSSLPDWWGEDQQAVPVIGHNTRHFVVFRGTQIGVYKDWASVAPLVQGIPGSVYKSYPTYPSAVSAFKAAKVARQVAIIDLEEQGGQPSSSSRR